MILVSACLLGHHTKYNGQANSHALLMQYNALGNFVAVCPECLGKLPIPHPPAEIVGGNGQDVLLQKASVVNKINTDVTINFISGAEKVLKIAEQYGIRTAILKERSPSCGVEQIYDGTFCDAKITGQGVTTALLRKHGFRVYSDEEITKALLEQLLKEA